MTETLIKAEHLTRFYGPNCAVEDVSFTLAKGEVLGFLGPNGAGKSSTMQMLTGNLAPSMGHIEVNGIDLLDNPREAKRELGYLPEQPPLYRELTVDEYLQYCARLNRLARSAIKAAVDSAKERCGLGDVSKRLIGNLSKGYQQRVGIAQAILHNPAVVILDEPTVGLDPIQIREIRTLIRDLGENHGIILSTHILPEVQGTCSHVQIIHQGRLVYSDNMANLEQAFQARQLILQLRNPPTPTDLESIAGVTGAQALNEHRFMISFDGDSPAEAIVDAACEHGWGLQEMTPERRSLEQLFVELTARDHGEAA